MLSSPSLLEGHGLDPEAHLLVAGDLGPKLELGSAAGDGEARRAQAEVAGQRQLEVEAGCVQLDIEPVGDGERSVDGGNSVNADRARAGVAAVVHGGKGAGLGADGDEVLGAVADAPERDARRRIGPIDVVNVDARGVLNAVHRIRNRRGGRTAGECQDVHAVIAGDFQRDGRPDGARLELEPGLLAGGQHLNGDRRERGGSEVGLLDVQRLDRVAVDAAGDVIQVAVEQMQAGECGGVADARDALDGGVNLKLVGFDLVLREGAAVGRLDHQPP